MVLSFDEKRIIKKALKELYDKICSYTEAASPLRLPSELILYAHIEFFNKINEAFASHLDGDNKYREQLYTYLELDSFMPDARKPFEESKAEEVDYFNRIAKKLEI